MILNPPLKILNVEVVSIDSVTKEVNFSVHVNGTIEDLATMQIASEIHSSVSKAVSYLEKEGYMEKPLEKWLTHVAAILHNPNT